MIINGYGLFREFTAHQGQQNALRQSARGHRVGSFSIGEYIIQAVTHSGSGCATVPCSTMLVAHS